MSDGLALIAFFIEITFRVLSSNELFDFCYITFLLIIVVNQSLVLIKMRLALKINFIIIKKSFLQKITSHPQIVVKNRIENPVIFCKKMFYITLFIVCTVGHTRKPIVFHFYYKYEIIIKVKNNWQFFFEI